MGSLEKLYLLIKKRLKKANEIKLALMTKDNDQEVLDYNMREMGSLFIPSFIEFEKEIKNQKEKTSMKIQKVRLNSHHIST